MIRAACYGRLGGDPIERSTRAGKVMATGSLAVYAARPDDGADAEPVWIGLIAFGEQAEGILRHGKSDPIAVSGELHRRFWTDRSGMRREAWSLTVESIVSAHTAHPGRRKRSGAGAQKAQGSPPANSADHELDDPLPPFGTDAGDSPPS